MAESVTNSEGKQSPLQTKRKVVLAQVSVSVPAAKSEDEEKVDSTEGEQQQEIKAANAESTEAGAVDAKDGRDTRGICILLTVSRTLHTHPARKDRATESHTFGQAFAIVTVR